MKKLLVCGTCAPYYARSTPLVFRSHDSLDRHCRFYGHSHGPLAAAE